MPSIHIPVLLRSYVGGKEDVVVHGLTTREALEDMLGQFPGFRPQLCKPDGSLRAFVNLFLDGKNIKDLHGLDTDLKSDDILVIVPSIAGG